MKMADCSFVVSLDHQAIDGKQDTKTDLREILRKGVDWVRLCHYRAQWLVSLRMVAPEGKTLLDHLSN
jgi:hypothetical protein